MTKQAELILQDDVIFVKGDLNFANVMQLRQQSLAQFDHRSQLTFDFSEVKSSDSSGLALVIEWLKLGEKSKTKIHLKNIPNDLMSIAKASGLDALIK